MGVLSRRYGARPAASTANPSALACFTLGRMAVGNLLLRWLWPSPTGPIDRATYRLRLILAIQIAVFGLVSFLVLSVGRSTSVLLSLPEFVSHLLLGLALWNNRTTWNTVLPVASIGVVGVAMGESAVVEVMFIFFIIPVVFPFYSSTKDALTTQILVWVMVAGAGTGMVVVAPDRMPWTWFIVQIAAIGVVGTLMVMLRFSILHLIGANQRLENNLAQYHALYDDGYRVTLVIGDSGHVREVHGAAAQLFGIEASRVVGKALHGLAGVGHRRPPAVGGLPPWHPPSRPLGHLDSACRGGRRCSFRPPGAGYPSAAGPGHSAHRRGIRRCPFQGRHSRGCRRLSLRKHDLRQVLEDPSVRRPSATPLRPAEVPVAEHQAPARTSKPSSIACLPRKAKPLAGPPWAERGYHRR